MKAESRHRSATAGLCEALLLFADAHGTNYDAAGILEV